jgi:hypothetical protein
MARVWRKYRETYEQIQLEIFIPSTVVTVYYYAVSFVDRVAVRRKYALWMDGWDFRSSALLQK